MYKTNLPQYFKETVEKFPAKTALIENETSYTFNELHEQVLKTCLQINRILENKKNQIVAVLIPKSAQAVMVDIAVNYSCNTYMNMDVKNPPLRLKSIYDTIKPSALITTREMSADILEIFQNVPVLLIEDIEKTENLSAIQRDVIFSRHDEIVDRDLLCIINTSGSTGVPKGVALAHRGFIDFIYATRQVGILDEDDIMASFSPYIFDIYTFEVCRLMMFGATMLLLPEHFAAFPIKLLEIMKEKQASFLFWVPTIMVNIANMDLFSQISLPHLTTIWFAGEVFPTAKCNYWRKHFSEAKFVNLYGPIEISLDCTYYHLSHALDDNEAMPIGLPFPNKEILLIKDDNTLATGGEDGEICVRGCGMAHGYYNDFIKTQEVFIQNPFNSSYTDLIYKTGDIGAYNKEGEILFKGRKDTLIKHSGYRIELADIENTIIASIDNIKNCCALYDEQEKKIVLIYESKEEVLEKELKKQIGKVLPRYMVPSKYFYLNELPRNTNGKIDRLNLFLTHIKNKKG